MTKADIVRKLMNGTGFSEEVVREWLFAGIDENHEMFNFMDEIKSVSGLARQIRAAKQALSMIEKI